MAKRENFSTASANIRIDGRVAHFELGQIPEHATEMRAAANFLVANYGRQKIITMPRAVPKIAIFEEAARTLEIPGGYPDDPGILPADAQIWLQHSGGGPTVRCPESTPRFAEPS